MRSSFNPVHGISTNCTIEHSRAKCQCPPGFEGDLCEFRKKKITKIKFQMNYCLRFFYIDQNSI